jgi:nicotinamidase-related amidase
MSNTASTINEPSSPYFYGPSNTALLLLDFHRLFVGQAIGIDGSAALSVAVEMRSWAQARGIPVIHALIDVSGQPFPECKGLEGLKAFLASVKPEDAKEATELLQGSTNNEVTFTRAPGYVSALKSPLIEEFLHERGIKSLILTGLSTSGCVMRTAIQATDAEFVVSVISDACADRDEEVHRVVTEKILPSRGYVSTGTTFRQEYENAMGTA